MARLPRFFAAGFPLHIIQRGHNRAPIFLSPKDFNCYRRQLGDAAGVHGVAIHAYVLMTNHVHVLASPASAVSVPKTMQSVAQRYAIYFNAVYRQTGTPWEGRYKATVVDSDAYLLTLMRYIEQNPVRAGMVAAPAAYVWSSHRANAHGSIDRLVTPHRLYSGLGRTAEARQSMYRGLFAAPVADTDLDAIRDATHHAWALGDLGFRQDVEALGGRRTTRLPLGRPPRN